MNEPAKPDLGTIRVDGRVCRVLSETLVRCPGKDVDGKKAVPFSYVVVVVE